MKKQQTNWRELLPHLCLQGFGLGEGHYVGKFCQPWLMDIDGDEHSLVTDGYHLVIVEGRHCDRVASSDVTDMIGNVTSKALVSQGEITLAKLKTWCGEPHSLVPSMCNDCLSGKQSCECCGSKIACHACGGAGKTIKARKESPGVVRSCTIDRAKLAHILRGCHDETVAMKANERTLYLAGSDWRLWLEQLATKRLPPKRKVPVFEERKVGK